MGNKSAVRMTAERQSDGRWRVNGSQGWGVGVDFPSEEAATFAARAIELAANGKVDLSTITLPSEPVRYGYVTDGGLVVCDGHRSEGDEPYNPQEGDDWCSVCDANITAQHEDI